MKIDWLERLKSKAEHPEIHCQNCQKAPAAAPTPNATKPLRVPDRCWQCPDGWARCHVCEHGCKVPLEIGKSYPADHIFH